jgi:hypothetical protein
MPGVSESTPFEKVIQGIKGCSHEWSAVQRNRIRTKQILDLKMLSKWCSKDKRRAVSFNKINLLFIKMQVAEG